MSGILVALQPPDGCSVHQMPAQCICLCPSNRLRMQSNPTVIRDGQVKGWIRWMQWWLLRGWGWNLCLGDWKAGCSKKICTTSWSDNVSSNLIYLISSSSVSLLLSLFLLLFFCVSVSLTCFSLDLFVPHFGSWPVENRALIPQTVDCVPVIKPYLFLCFQSFVLSSIFFLLSLALLSFFLIFFLLISILFCISLFQHGKKWKEFNSRAARNQTDFPHGLGANLRLWFEGQMLLWKGSWAKQCWGLQAAVWWHGIGACHRCAGSALAVVWCMSAHGVSGTWTMTCP